MDQIFVAFCELALIANWTVPFKAIGFKGSDNALIGPGLLTGLSDSFAIGMIVTVNYQAGP